MSRTNRSDRRRWGAAVDVLLVSLLIASCSRSPGTGSVTPTSSSSANSTPSVALSPSQSATPSASPSPSFSPYPYPTPTQGHVRHSFYLEIRGIVPSDEAFSLDFDFPNTGQRGFALCDPALNHPCNVAGNQLAMSFDMPMMAATGHYAYSLDRNGQQIEVFAQGDIDLTVSNNVVASYSFAS